MNLFHRLDCFLRNCPVRESGELIPFEDVFDGPPNPWYTRLYYKIIRIKVVVIGFPRYTYYGIKYFIQRGRRGWADCDTWSLDNYLSEWLPAALRHLKETKHGVPCGMFDGLPQDDNGNGTEEAWPIAEARWDDIMNKMIAGFEAWERMEDGLYEKELGEYPLDRPKDVSKEAWKAKRDERFKKSEVLRAHDQKIHDEGMALFIKHFSSLWD